MTSPYSHDGNPPGRFTISKGFELDGVSHELRLLPDGHKCRRNHGHNYLVTLTVAVDGLDAKRKITVTVNAATLEQAQALGVQNLSAVVDEALEIHVERLARQAALRDLLDAWDREAGPVPEVELAAARATFDGLAADRRSA